MFDSELRNRVKEFRRASSATVLASDVPEAIDQFTAMNEIADLVNDRIAELLPKLY